MGSPVKIRRMSQDHGEFCRKCQHVDKKGWWTCELSGERCFHVAECPAGKWERV